MSPRTPLILLTTECQIFQRLLLVTPFRLFRTVVVEVIDVFYEVSFTPFYKQTTDQTMSMYDWFLEYVKGHQLSVNFHLSVTDGHGKWLE